jgi:hypothetical protein
VVEQGLLREVAIVAGVLAEHDHRVAGVVRVVVEHDERAVAPGDHEVLAVVVALWEFAEDAPVDVLVFVCSFDPLDAPRREDLLHVSYVETEGFSFQRFSSASVRSVVSLSRFEQKPQWFDHRPERSDWKPTFRL